MEAELLRKDGAYVPVEISSRVIEHGNNTVQLCFMRDLRPRKKQQRLLDEQAQLNKQILATSLNAYLLLDLDGNILDANAWKRA